MTSACDHLRYSVMIAATRLRMAPSQKDFTTEHTENTEEEKTEEFKSVRVVGFSYPAAFFRLFFFRVFRVFRGEFLIRSAASANRPAPAGAAPPRSASAPSPSAARRL